MNRPTFTLWGKPRDLLTVTVGVALIGFLTYLAVSTGISAAHEHHWLSVMLAALAVAILVVGLGRTLWRIRHAERKR